MVCSRTYHILQLASCLCDRLEETARWREGKSKVTERKKKPGKLETSLSGHWALNQVFILFFTWLRSLEKNPWESIRHWWPVGNLSRFNSSLLTCIETELNVKLTHTTGTEVRVCSGTSGTKLRARPLSGNKWLLGFKWLKRCQYWYCIERILGLLRGFLVSVWKVKTLS